MFSNTHIRFTLADAINKLCLTIISLLSFIYFVKAITLYQIYKLKNIIYLTTYFKLVLVVYDWLGLNNIVLWPRKHLLNIFKNVIIYNQFHKQLFWANQLMDTKVIKFSLHVNGVAGSNTDKIFLCLGLNYQTQTTIGHRALVNSKEQSALQIVTKLLPSYTQPYL